MVIIASPFYEQFFLQGIYTSLTSSKEKASELSLIMARLDRKENMILKQENDMHSDLNEL